MARVLVAGGAGFVGSAAVRALARAGHEVIAGVRRRPGWPVPPAVTLVQLDVLDPASAASAARGCDVLINCTVGDPRDTRVITAGTDSLLAAADGRRFIQLSSVAVYGDVRGEIGEDASTASPTGRYGAAKLRAEQACGRHTGVAILRPALIHGPGSAQWTAAYLDCSLAGAGGRMGAAGEGDCNLIHVDDLAGFIRHLVENPPGEPSVFNVNGPEIPSWNDYLERLAGAVGAPFAAHVDPPGAARLAARKAAKALLAAGLGNAALRRFVARTPSTDEVARFGRKVRYTTAPMAASGFAPTKALGEALAEVAAWHRAGRPPLGW